MYQNWYSFNDVWHLSDKVKIIGMYWKYLKQIQNNRHEKI